MFICITFFMLPLFYGYSQNEVLGLKNESKYAINQFSLGNLGGASTLCVQKRVGTKEVKLTCPSGIMNVGSKVHIGMMAKDTSIMNHCMEQSIWKTEDRNKLTDCTSTLNH